MIMYDKQVS